MTNIIARFRRVQTLEIDGDTLAPGEIVSGPWEQVRVRAVKGKRRRRAVPEGAVEHVLTPVHGSGSAGDPLDVPGFLKRSEAI